MSHPHDHGHGSHGASVEKHFSDADWSALQADDLHAGKAVIGLMVSIFSIGLFLYLGVCLVVLANPMY